MPNCNKIKEGFPKCSDILGIGSQVYFLSIICKLVYDVLTERTELYEKFAGKFPEFDTLDDMGKFVFLFTFKDAQMLTWLGKFLYKSFTIKASQWNGNVMLVATSGSR